MKEINRVVLVIIRYFFWQYNCPEHIIKGISKSPIVEIPCLKH